MHLGCGASFGVWDASPASAAAYAVTARGAAQPAEKPSTTMTTDPNGKPYAHNAEQAEAAKAALQAWDELTDTTHPRAFGRMKDAMEKLRDANEPCMTLPTAAPTHSEIAWYVRELTEAKAREERMLAALRLVAKHADFSQCPDGVEEAVDAALLPPNTDSGIPSR